MPDTEEGYYVGMPKPRPCPKCGKEPGILSTGIHSLDGHEFGFIFQCDCGLIAFDDGGSFPKAVEMWDGEMDRRDELKGDSE